MKGGAFSDYHPLVNFIFFALVIICAMFFLHPLALAVGLLCSFTYSLYLGGKKSLRFNLLYLLPLMLFAALLNPAFNHRGVTILRYFPNGNPLTLESICFGLAAAVMLVTVICWFSCYNYVMSSDKFIYLFGRIIPGLSLILSMVLRLVPRFCYQARQIADGQKALGRDIGAGGLPCRIKNGLKIVSALISISLEEAIDTADSMKSRGYGLPGRTAFSIYKWQKRDSIAFTAMAVLGVYIIIGALSGAFTYKYFPGLQVAQYGFYTCSVWAAYFLLCIIPLVIELAEEKKWRAIQSKI
ncbi:MAG: energy-coupling factor transporter transmembrane component T [Clostridia bacterium]|nr:energy-coupling factor transporter transmembrane component T [Clostridia bacterium]